MRGRRREGMKRAAILILALTPNTPIPAPESPVVTFEGMGRVTG